MAFINCELRRDSAMDDCIRNVIDDIESIRRKLIDSRSWSLTYCERAKELWELMRTFHLCGKLGKLGVHCESAVCTLEENVYKQSLEIRVVCLPYLVAFEDLETFANNKKHYLRVCDSFEERNEAICGEMEEMYQVFSNASLQTSSTSSHIEMEDLLVIVDSLLDFQCGLNLIDDLKQSIRFLKNFICFVAFRGINSREMGDLLMHIRGVLVDAACLFFRQVKSDCDVSYESPDTSKLIDRIEPLESQVCEIYVRVLQQASELSNNINLAPAGSRIFVLADFVDSLLFLLFQLFFRNNGHMFIVDHQLYKLCKRLRFLRTTLREQHDDKVDELCTKMHDLIGILICEAGVIICYIFHGGKERIWGERLELFLSGFEEKFKLCKPEEEEEASTYYQLASACPQTNLLGFLDSILEKMKSSDQYEAEDSAVASSKNKLKTIHDDIAYLRSFLVNVMGIIDQNEKLQVLWSRVSTVAYETEFVLDSLLVGDTHQSFIVILETIITEIELIKTEAMGISNNMEQIVQVRKIAKTDSKKLSAGKIPEFNESIVGLDDEAQKIIARLKRGSKKLDVVSIVGMGGLGKTTLAKKVYRDSSITLHFHVHIWSTISQVWNKRTLLFATVNRLGEKSLDELMKMSEDDLGDVLRKYLKGKRYLVILDDVWDVDVWSSLRVSFPCDGTGSRILLTTRLENVALQIKPGSEPHHLRFLTNAESKELFFTKMCFEEGCSPELLARGEAIATCCKGLPLMIVVVAGVLSKMEPSIWEEIEESLKKGDLRGTGDQWKEILELSYLHLPDYLKPCFLYFATRKEDERVNVHRLLWLWIAEGFVKKTEKECVEDVAEGYMMELIQRNLVMVAERGSRGGVKECVLHDLLHDFCKEKGEQEHFVHQLHCHELGISTQPRMLYRLLVKPAGRVEESANSGQLYPHLRTLLFEDDDKEIGYADKVHWYGILYNFCQSKLLRVLGLNRVFSFPSFPSAIQLFTHLTYLSLCIDESVPSSIACLSNLETLVIESGGIHLPQTIWSMKKLRHMSAWWWEFPMELPKENPEHVSSLENMYTMSRILYSDEQTMKEVTRKIPNVCRLSCVFPHEEQGGGLKIFTFDYLSQLESLSINHLGETKSVYRFQFPYNLKKLTLSNVHLPWTEISAIDRLPNLEVLKLLVDSFTGETWHVGGEGTTFPKLRFLKMYNLPLVRWTMDSEDNFPCLEKLVLEICWWLEELPIYLAQSSTLGMIEVNECDKAANSVKDIEEKKTEVGNEDQKILFRPAEADE